MKKTLIFLLVTVLLLPAVFYGNDYTLASNGKLLCHIVLPADASMMEKYAADELAHFIQKMAKTGEKPSISSKTADGKNNIFLCTKTSEVARKVFSGRILKNLTNEGYALKCVPGAVYLAGGNKEGVIYGVYAFLQKLGMRWFHPAPHGEYCPDLKVLKVGKWEENHNPSFVDRRLSAGANFPYEEKPFYLWMTRNKMPISLHKYGMWRKDWQLETSRRPYRMGSGGHAMSSLLEAGTKKGELFKQHPEYYGIWNGKRNLRKWYCQPCTSNPEVIRRMAKGIMEYFNKPPAGNAYLLGNDDHSRWCQCGNCSVIDSEFDKKMNYVSTRYFTMIRDVYNVLKKNNAKGQLQAWAYQNYQHPPGDDFDLPEEVHIIMCPHGRCYVHTLDDPECKDNAKFYDIFKKWQKRKNLKTTLEYPGNLPSGCDGGELCTNDCPGVIYLPLDRQMADTIKKYHSLGIRGVSSFITAYGTRFGGLLKRNAYTENMNLSQWHYYYISAAMLWDVNQDFNTLFEDYGTKYYGKAWKYMRPYRLLLMELFENGPHMRYGTPNERLGECLNPLYARERLLYLLCQAEKVCEDDPLLTKRITDEKNFFMQSFVRIQDRLQADLPEMRRTNRPETPLAMKSAKLTADGFLKEKEWKRAEYITHFRTNGSISDPATTLRVLYNDTTLLFGFELPGSFDAATGKIRKAPGGETLTLTIHGITPLTLRFLSDGTFDAGGSTAKGVMRDAGDMRTAEIMVDASQFNLSLSNGNLLTISAALSGGRHSNKVSRLSGING